MNYGEMTFDELKKALDESQIEFVKKKKEYKEAKDYIKNWPNIKAELQNELSEKREKLKSKISYKQRLIFEDRIKELEDLLLNDKGLNERKEKANELKRELFPSFSGGNETIPERILSLKTEIKGGPKSSKDIFDNKRQRLQEEFKKLTDEKEIKERTLRFSDDNQTNKELESSIAEIEKKISEIETDTYNKESNEIERGKYSDAKKKLSDKRKEARDSLFGEAEEGAASIAVGVKALSLARKFAFTQNQKERIRDKYAYYVEQSEKQIKRIAVNRLSPDFIKKKKIKSLSESRKQAKIGLEEATIEASQENFIDKFFDFGRNFAVDDEYIGLSVDEIVHKIDPSSEHLDDASLVEKQSSEERTILKYNIYESDSVGRIETIKSTSEELLKNKNVQENEIKTTKEAKNFTDLVSETRELKSTAIVLNSNSSIPSGKDDKHIKSIADSQKQIRENTERQASALEKIHSDLIDEQDTTIKGTPKKEEEKEPIVKMVENNKKDDEQVGLGILGVGLHTALMGMIPALGTALLGTLKAGVGPLVSALVGKLFAAAPWIAGIAGAGAVGYAIGTFVNDNLLSESTKETIGDTLGFAVDNVLSLFGNEEAQKRLEINANKDKLLSGFTDRIPNSIGKDDSDNNMLKDFDKINKVKNEIIDLEETKIGTRDEKQRQEIDKRIIEKQGIIKEALARLNLPPEVNKENNMITIENDYNKTINETVKYDVRTTGGSGGPISAQAIGINNIGNQEKQPTNSFELFNK